MGPSNQTLHKRRWHWYSLPCQLHPGPMGSPGEPGHGHAATDHDSFDFFSGISLSPKHQAAAGTRRRAFMTPTFPLFCSANREMARAGVPSSVPLQDHSASAHILHWTFAAAPPARTILMPFNGV